ncbi:MAG TPA: efflux RND transporter permease subunit [Micropepsaceae bacterium]|nr:efflux RND transporter permease subunit [Micropepsaceae bacterium]
MKFTDIFIRKPVLATVVSLVILVIGIRAGLSLPIRQYPRTENAVVTVTTAYYGADPDVVAGFITQPLENAIAQANGIDYITSSSTNSLSTISVNLRLNYDYNRAVTEITSKISSVLNRLPPQSQQPVLQVQVGQAVSAMYLGFRSTVLKENQITDYLTRVVQPKLQAVPGVQTVNLLGARNFALRAWLDPAKLAAFGLTAADVDVALAANDYISGLGNTKGQMVQVNLTASTGLHSLDEFRNLVVKQSNGAVVRLSDVANVMLGSEDYNSNITYNGQNSIAMSVDIAPDANLLDVLKRVQQVFPQIRSQLPQGLEGAILYDASDFVSAAISEVEMTIIKTLLIVMLVIFLFLGSVRSVVIPVIAIPLSLVGAFIIMLPLGFSINLLSLLAMVLAIGLVVDDAIIVVENVHRHINEGAKPFDAAIQAARELAGPIIAMMIVLIAVYVPIAFQGGLTGALFIEFAFTLVATISISTVIALTLSPMMCSRLLRPHGEGATSLDARIAHFIDARFERLHAFYGRRLRSVLDYLPVTIVFAVIVVVGTASLWMTTQQELAPQEDQGFIFAFGAPSPTATVNQYGQYSAAVYNNLRSDPNIDFVFQLDSPAQLFKFFALKPWDVRAKNSVQVQNAVQREVTKFPVFNNFFVAQPPPLPSNFGAPVQFVISTTESFDRLNTVVQSFMDEVRKTGKFPFFLDTNLKLDRPEVTVDIDRDKTALMGLSMGDIGNALSAMLGGGYVNYFSMEGRSYRVMAQADQPYRLNPSQLLDYYIRAPNGSLVPLSTVAHITSSTTPESLNHFQQLNAATINAMVGMGMTQGSTLELLRGIAARTLPQGYVIDYAGTSRQYVQESSGFITLLGFAAVIIFLALAALFESFRAPLIILIAVPMSIAGAMAALHIVFGLHVFYPEVMQFGGGTMNIYTLVGIVTLMGLISKHGILIVDVANRLQREGHPKREAVQIAAGIRLRPILMTTAAMVLGVVPLLLSTGAGAVARFAMGLVIFSGISVGTLFTLFVVPSFYILLAADYSRIRARNRVMEAYPAPGE